MSLSLPLRQPDQEVKNGGAEFLTDGGDAERPYLYNNGGSGPSNRHHRFADQNGSITYRFDLPDSVTDAKLTVDMANNFVVSIASASTLARYAHVSPGEANEKDSLLASANTEQPSLQVRVQGQSVRLSWPAAATGAVLESAAAVNGPWAADSALTTVEGSEMVALVSPEGRARFYRLRAP